MRTLHYVRIIAALLLGGCGLLLDSVVPVDAGPTSDAGQERDAGTEMDASIDSGPLEIDDAGEPDSGLSYADSGPDAGPDAGADAGPDAGPTCGRSSLMGCPGAVHPIDLRRAQAYFSTTEQYDETCSCLHWHLDPLGSEVGAPVIRGSEFIPSDADAAGSPVVYLQATHERSPQVSIEFSEPVQSLTFEVLGLSGTAGAISGEETLTLSVNGAAPTAIQVMGLNVTRETDQVHSTMSNGSAEITVEGPGRHFTISLEGQPVLSSSDVYGGVELYNFYYRL